MNQFSKRIRWGLFATVFTMFVVLAFCSATDRVPIQNESAKTMPLRPQSPSDVIVALSNSSVAVVFCEPVETFVWRLTDIEKVLPFLKDGRSCARIVSTASSTFPHDGKSTLSQEAELIVFGYLVGLFPARLDSTRLSEAERNLVNEFCKNYLVYRKAGSKREGH